MRNFIELELCRTVVRVACMDEINLVIDFDTIETKTRSVLPRRHGTTGLRGRITDATNEIESCLSFLLMGDIQDKNPLYCVSKLE